MSGDLLHSAQTQMALAFGRLRIPVYEGTVTHADKTKRRKRGKVARASRKANRS